MTATAADRGARTRSASALVWLAVLVAAAGVALRFHAWQDRYLVALSAFAPYLMLAGPVATAALALRRRWRRLLVPLLLSCTLVVLEAPLFTGGAADGQLRVLTVNVDLGQADPTAVVAAARRERADVLAVEELTAPELAGLAAAGIDAAFPYRFAAARTDAAGTGIWSRYPLRDQRRLPGFSFAVLAADIVLPARTVGVVALHLAGPWPSSAAWNRDIAALRRVLDAVPGPALALGDFNATYDQQQFRALLATGFADAAERAGAGWAPTYPADRWFPPLITIDHVLAKALTGASAHTVYVPGTDHRALVADLSAPR